MSSISEQISAVAKTSITNPLAIINAMSKTAFASMEKIIALNLHTVKQSLDSSTTATRELFSANKPQELFALSTAQAQPNLAKIVAYGREFADISAQTSNEFLFNLTHSGEVITTVVSHQTVQPVVSTPVAKIEKKLSANTEVLSNTPNTQLPLLADAEVKVTKNAAPKTKKLPVASTTSSVATTVASKTAAAKPSAISKTPEKKSAAPKPVEVDAVVKTTIKPVAKAPATKAPATKPAAPKAETVATVETTPVAESPVEKKSAVKMPFPASPMKKPAFPTVSTRPVYKAKGSAATGAKKPVRQ